MANADVTRAEAAVPGASEENRAAAKAKPPIGPSSPVLAAAWLLRPAALLAVLASAMGVIVAPGLRGNAGEAVVVVADRASATFAFVLLAALLGLALAGGAALFRTSEIAAAPRAAMIAAATAVFLLSLTGLRDRVPPFVSVLISAAGAVACLAGAYAAAAAPHTRATAGVLVLFAFAAIARLGAWELAMRAGDTANLSLFGMSRSLATAGVFLEAGGQLTAIMWIAARGRGWGQLACCLALGVAYALTWGVAQGVHSDASVWQAVVHTALADASGVPAPYGVVGFATFLVPASILLALSASVQAPGGTAIAVATAMALALISRGAFDAPLRALAAVVAAQWAALAAVDSRAMWRTLLADRKADEAANAS
jgi:hypothetical protein